MICLGDRWRPEGGGVTVDKYFLTLGGQQTMLTLDYDNDASGTVRIATVKFSSPTQKHRR